MSRFLPLVACVALLGPGARAAAQGDVGPARERGEARHEFGDARDVYRDVDDVARAIGAGELGPSDADVAYRKLTDILRTALDSHRGTFRGARSETDPVADAESAEEDAVFLGDTVAELHASIDTLYDARLLLLEVVSPELRASVTGAGVEGTRQLRLELDYLERFVHFQRIAIPAGLRDVRSNIVSAPLPWLSGTLIAILAWLILRAWQRWATAGIPRLRDLTLRAWRHHPAALPVSELLRYVMRVRRPLEAVVFFWILFAMLRVPRLADLLAVARIVLFWILFAWFAVSLADAFAARGNPTRSGPERISERRSQVRLRTLRIVAAWIVFLGLGLQLAGQLVGRATLHAWVFKLFLVLALPVALLLLRLWRPSIQERLEREEHFSTRVARLRQRRGPLAGPVQTLGGAFYLLLLGARRVALKIVRKSALGRTLVAEALRQSMIRAVQEDAPDEADVGLGSELRARWLKSDAIVESAIEDELAEALGMLERGWRSIAVVGERGAGKSVFVRRLAAAYDGEALIVSCPHGGADGAIAAICRTLEVEDAEPSAEAAYAAAKERGIRLIGWDDLHRLCRPVLGGQDELNRLLQLTSSWSEIVQVATLDAAAWEYMSRLREGTIGGTSTVTLSAWTEAQLGELFDSRAREAGILLDYGELRFPRLLLEHDFDTPEAGLYACFRRILWAEADGNPAVALRLVADHSVEREAGVVSVRLPSSSSASELESMKLVELLVLRFLVQTDGATSEELLAGLRYPEPVLTTAVRAAADRGLLDENHGRYRISWEWYRAVTRVLARRNMLGAAQHRAERDLPQPHPSTVRRGYAARGGRGA